LNQLDELALVYYKIRNHLDLFLELFHTLRKETDQMEIEEKKQIISNLDRRLNHKIYALEEKLNKIDSVASNASE
jgi:hypothetical protein